MKYFSPILFAMFLTLTGCGQSAEASNARDKAREALDAFGAYAEMGFEGMATDLKNGWSVLQTETAKLRDAAKAKGVQLKDSIATAIVDAEAKAAAAGKMLAAAGAAGADNAKESWGHAKLAFDEATAAVEKAWKELRK